MSMQPAFEGTQTDDRAIAGSLLDWLAEQGYAMEAQSGEVEGGGNAERRLVRGACQVTVSRDRGQWYVEAGPRDRAGFDMNIWDAYLHDELPPVVPALFDDEVRVLRNVLHEIERSLVLDAESVERLDRLQSWRQEARWSPPSA